jgi:hypothetical protein
MIQSEDRFLAECLILSKFQQLSNEDSVEDKRPPGFSNDWIVSKKNLQIVILIKN